MKPQIIALEEHYTDEELTSHFPPEDAVRIPPIATRLADMGALRIKEMDEAGIDIQVLSHNAPATQNIDPAIAVDLAKRVNDRLAEAVKAHPTRFAGFASLPTQDPKAAADELERTVTKLGFKGAMIHGLANGQWLDDRKFWPLYERAQALDVPIYLHPSLPQKSVVEAYYKEYAKDHPMFIRAAWGFTVESATQAIRLVLSGVFEQIPNVKFVLGHLGETLPYLLVRADESLSRNPAMKTSFREQFCKHFYITTSGNFSTPALMCAISEMGVDRIMFSVDWPYITNKAGVDWMKTVPVSDDDKVKILGGNAKKLLKL